MHVEGTKKAQVRACASNNITREIIMKETEKQVVFYSAKKDGFLESYKDKGNIVFEAVFDDRLWKALQLPIEFYEKQKNNIDKLAEAFNCEVLIVEVEYNVTKLDGSDFERMEREESIEDGFKTLLEILAK